LALGERRGKGTRGPGGEGGRIRVAQRILSWWERRIEGGRERKDILVSKEVGGGGGEGGRPWRGRCSAVVEREGQGGRSERLHASRRV
jgi:hypothetical protein